MKKILLSLTICLGLTACGGSSDNNIPEGYVGLWAERIDLDAADSLNFNSINDGTCEIYQEDSRFPQLDATLIDSSGNIYGVTGNGFGVIQDQEPSAVMNSEGFVEIFLEDEAREFGFDARAQFELVAPGVVIATTTVLQNGSLSAREANELVQVSDEEFSLLVDTVMSFCSPL